MSKSWYILQTYTGYERKVERLLQNLLTKKELDSHIVTDIKVPIQEIVEVKDGKQKVHRDLFMPGYLLMEMDLPETNWRDTCATIRKITGVNGFVGTNPNERPRPISNEEALSLLERMGVVKSAKPVKVVQTYEIGDRVRIKEGPFATFSGVIKEMNDERNRLSVRLEIFGRETVVDVTDEQVERA